MSTSTVEKLKNIAVPDSVLFDKAITAACVPEYNRPFYHLWVRQ